MRCPPRMHDAYHYWPLGVDDKIVKENLVISQFVFHSPRLGVPVIIIRRLEVMNFDVQMVSLKAIVWLAQEHSTQEEH